MEVVCVSIIEEKIFAEKNVDDNISTIYKIICFSFDSFIQQMYDLLLGQIVVKAG